MGVKISKRHSSHSYDSFFDQTFPKNSLWQSSQKLLIGILKFQILKFLKKIEIFINMGPNGSCNFKTLLLLQLLFFLDQPFSKCSLWQSSQKLLIGILKFQI